MKGFNSLVVLVVMYVLCAGCVSTKESKNTMGSPGSAQNTLNIIERLKTDLGKSVYTIISENPAAIRQNQNSLVYGDEDTFASGKFYGYSWKIKDGFIYQVNYSQPFEQKSYQNSVNGYISVLGKGMDLNGNGFRWSIPEKGGITIILVNESNNSIVHSSLMGYSDIPVK